ncbi:nuclease-related domain-containing protein [Hahella sp. HN01]|uniref:nuclease-related domain-containing protein n=1 Tax=Hahella sp. HN01 TaxID=2847262 RepID=UPI001C1EBC19|nr:NERD domain-containing protein [Hahella sp. HN01]MBU6951619.1 NERD domain-containing protein [Hahella sp. HN01]
MDYSPMINQAFKLWWLIPIFLFISVFKTPWLKGILGEILVKFSARLRLPKDTYHRIHYVTLPTPDGTTQIDHIFVSQFGIFVVETKNMKGWIFGNENQPQWTQKIFRNSFKFQNPLRQNYKHVKALEAVLDVPPDTIHSVVVFAGDSKFKSQMPPNVTSGGGFITYIKSFSAPVLSETQVQRVVEQIASGRLEPTRETHRQHIQQIKARSNILAERKCPRCGSNMVLRKAKQGANAGRQFWGCSAYPKCRAVQNAI